MLVFAPFPTWKGQMRRALVTNEVLVHTPPIPTYPEDLLPELQRLLAALADLDARETKREHLEEWSPWIDPYRSSVSRRSSGKCRSLHSRLSGLRDPPSCLREGTSLWLLRLCSVESLS